jgi:hypothetical protein
MFKFAGSGTDVLDVARRRFCTCAFLTLTLLVLLPAGPATSGRELIGQPRIVSPSVLKAVSVAVGHPVYWAGRRAPNRIELTLITGRVYVRYLPPGAKAGSKRRLLTVGTYDVPNAYVETLKLATQYGFARIPVGHSGIAVYPKAPGTNVYLAYRGSNVQIEVYDPVAEGAKKLVRWLGSSDG